jgi:hypothetical protein
MSHIERLTHACFYEAIVDIRMTASAGIDTEVFHAIGMIQPRRRLISLSLKVFGRLLTLRQKCNYRNEYEIDGLLHRPESF